jgi:hypothetical protein
VAASGIVTALAGGAQASPQPWLGVVGATASALVLVSRPGALLVAAALVLPAAWPHALGTGAAGVALGLAVGIAVADRRVLRSAVAIALPLAIVDLAWPTFTGGSAAVAGVAVTVLAASGLRALDPYHRRRALVGAGLAAGAVVVVGCAAATTIALQRTNLERAVDAIEAGLDATARGDSDAAAAHLADAADAFDVAAGRLDLPWVELGERIPVFGDQIHAVDVMVDAGASAADVGARAAATADPDSIRPRDGSVDLGRLDTVREQVVDARDALLDVRARVDSVRSPWLVPAISGELADVRSRSVDAVDDADAALEALAVVPGMLGADGERRWLLVIQTPSELRGAGGLPGNYGVLHAEHGRVELERVGRINEIAEPAEHGGIPVVGPADYLARYSAHYALFNYFQNSTVSPHFPSVAEAMTGRYEAVTNQVVDGAISLDPTGFASLLALIGPVQVDGWDVPIDANNAEQVLLHEQYERLVPDSDERVELLERLADAVFDRVVGGDLPGPGDVGAELAPDVAARHIQLWSRRPAEERWFAHIGASGALAPVVGDALAVISTNASEVKIDWYLHRDITYDVQTADDGTVQATLRVRLHNDAPTTGSAYVIGPSPYIDVTPGVNRTRLSIFTPLGLVDAGIDGRPYAIEPSAERGRNVYDVDLDVPPGGTVEVDLRLAGPVPAGYRLDLHHQPVVNPDTVRVTVDGEVLYDGAQDRDLTLTRS